MLDADLKAQLKSYLERVTQPIEIVASLDDSKASGELQALLKDIADSSALVKVTESRDDDAAQALVLDQPRRARTTASASPASRWATNSRRWCWRCCRSAAIRPRSTTP